MQIKYDEETNDYRLTIEGRTLIISREEVGIMYEWLQTVLKLPRRRE